MSASEELQTRIRRLQEEIKGLQEELKGREEALPAHSIRPHQLQAIEQLEQEIKRKTGELDALMGGRRPS